MQAEGTKRAKPNAGAVCRRQPCGYLGRVCMQRHGWLRGSECGSGLGTGPSESSRRGLCGGRSRAGLLGVHPRGGRGRRVCVRREGGGHGRGFCCLGRVQDMEGKWGLLSAKTFPRILGAGRGTMPRVRERLCGVPETRPQDLTRARSRGGQGAAHASPVLGGSLTCSEGALNPGESSLWPGSGSACGA